MTRRSSGIRAAWHFWFAVSFCGEGGQREVGLDGTHPLTRRYVLFCSTYLFLLFIPNKFSLLRSLCHDFYRMLFGIICPQGADS
ncbi:DUF3265 domain-containing protein [Vibrio cholerae]|nr:DUF3265 domain-containing protein [Vibrio cholerae]